MLKAISLFSGIGGIDFGFEAAGFQTRVALEFDRHCCNTMRLNRPTWKIIESDINQVSSQEILDQAGLRVGEADVLFGGPPCQPFSKAAYWVKGETKRLDDARSDTLTGYLRVLRDTQPRTFLLENVGGLAYADKDEGLQYLLEGIKKINCETGTRYDVHWRVLRCAEYGVPQLRERAFLVGSKDGRPFHFPEPTHSVSASEDLLATVEPYRTAWDAIGDLPEPDEKQDLLIGGRWGELLPTIPEGENYLWHTARKGGEPLFGWRTRYWSFLLKLSKRLPSWTVQAQPGSAIGPFHWDNRRLSFTELARLQTFPDGLLIRSGRTEMQRMLGNAVPSLMAEVLAREIKRQFLDKTVSDKPTLLPPRRHDVPAPEKVAPLPVQYRSLIGDHKAHKGTGKGPAAIARAKKKTPATA